MSEGSFQLVAAPCALAAVSLESESQKGKGRTRRERESESESLCVVAAGRDLTAVAHNSFKTRGC